MRPSPCLAAAAVLLGAVACGGDAAAPPVEAGATADADPGTPERPPQGQAALEAWLAAGHYLRWACEPGVSPMRLNGSHGRHRICSNAAVLATTTGAYPVGAASVKELFSAADQPAGFAVGVKVAADQGPQSWYWYERRGTDPTARPLAQGIGVPDCAVCHGGPGATDYIFIKSR